MKIKKRYKDYPKNVPRKLFNVLKYWSFNRSLAALALGVNSGYLSNLLNKGIEPTDTTRHGRDVRRKLFLKAYKETTRKANAPKIKIELPYYMKIWNHLTKEERHKVIKAYVDWKSTDKK